MVIDNAEALHEQITEEMLFYKKNVLLTTNSFHVAPVIHFVAN